MTGVCNFQDWLIKAMQFTLRDLKSEVPVVDGTVCAISTRCQTVREVAVDSPWVLYLKPLSHLHWRPVEQKTLPARYDLTTVIQYCEAY